MNGFLPSHDLFFESLEGTVVNYLTVNKYPNNCGEHQNDTSLRGPIYSQSLFLRGWALQFLSVVLLSYFDIHVFLYIFFKKTYFVCLCVWMCASVWMDTGCAQVPGRPEEGVGLPGDGVTGSVNLLTRVPIAQLSSSGSVGSTQTVEPSLQPPPPKHSLREASKLQTRG